MCLMVVAGDLGAAHVGLDLQRLVLAFAPGLTDPERTLLARRVLARAGRPQPVHTTSRVICLCAADLDVSDRFRQAHSIPMLPITGHEWAEARRLLGSAAAPRLRAGSILAAVGRRLLGSPRHPAVGVVLILILLLIAIPGAQ